MGGGLAAACLLLACLAGAQGLTFNVDPAKEECLYEDITAGTKVSGSFQVSTGGFLDIDVKVTGPDERTIYSVSKETEGRFTFIAAETGTFRACFGNFMSTVTPKTVSFVLALGESQPSSTVAKAEHISPLERSIMDLSSALSQVQAEQEYMRMRERAHRNTSESTNARVLWWSVAEAAALVAVSVFQVFYLRRFFETKHRV